MLNKKENRNYNEDSKTNAWNNRQIAEREKLHKEQIENGSLTVRKMTEKEKKLYGCN